MTLNKYNIFNRIEVIIYDFYIVQRYVFYLNNIWLRHFEKASMIILFVNLFSLFIP